MSSNTISKITVGDYTCFICKRRLTGVMEFVDHCPDQKDDYHLECDDCAKVTEAAARGDLFAKWLFHKLVEKDPATLKFVKTWKPRRCNSF